MFDYEDWCDRRNYVHPESGDEVLRYDPDGEYEARVGLLSLHGQRRVGLLYHVDAYAGGLPRGHVVFDNGDELHDVLFMFQRPDDAANDPTWWE